MVLTSEDYLNIANMVEEGGSCLEFEKGDELLHIEYTFKTEGYVEDDYFNGTGAFIETSRLFRIDSAVVTDGTGEEKVAVVDEDRISKLIA